MFRLNGNIHCFSSKLEQIELDPFISPFMWNIYTNAVLKIQAAPESNQQMYRGGCNKFWFHSATPVKIKENSMCIKWDWEEAIYLNEKSEFH